MAAAYSIIMLYGEPYGIDAWLKLEIPLSENLTPKSDTWEGFQRKCEQKLESLGQGFASMKRNSPFSNSGICFTLQQNDEFPLEMVVPSIFPTSRAAWAKWNEKLGAKIALAKEKMAKEHDSREKMNGGAATEKVK